MCQPFAKIFFILKKASSGKFVDPPSGHLQKQNIIL